MSESLSDFIARYIEPFEDVSYIYAPTRGWIVWRRGTGGNFELLHIRAFERGKGHGRQLLLDMLDELEQGSRECRPYHSIFGFTRVGNDEAKAFYGAMGFELQTVNGIYRDGEATLFWQSWERLKELHL